MHDMDKQVIHMLSDFLNQAPQEMVRAVIVQGMQQIYVRCPDDETFLEALNVMTTSFKEEVNPETTNSPEDLQALVEMREELNQQRKRMLEYEGFLSQGQSELQDLFDKHGVIDDTPGGTYL